MRTEDTQKPVTYYRDKYKPGIGTLTVARHTELEEHRNYQCEHCGKLYSFPAHLPEPEEPFFCRNCNKPVGIN